MASSSAIMPKEKYDVFISFRGGDTRKTFTSHLHAALIRKKIDTYIDYRLQKGEELESALLKAIEESKVYVIIFSEDYASSTWCLKELAYILECQERNGHYVIPVFYGIDPSDVRSQKRSYETAFSKHEQRLDVMDKVLKWKEALTKAANRSGFDSTSTAIRDDNDLVEQVVRDVLKKLNHESASNLTDHLVGVESRIQSIVTELDIIPDDNRVRFVVIWGMGGIGKTSLADAVFHGLSSQFEACCFLENVRERSGANRNFSPQLKGLRNELIRQLLGDENLDIHTPTVDSHVKERLNRTKVLVVLDDINHLSQLEFLVGEQVPFGPGSRIIITTRDMQPVRKMQLVDCDVKIYKVEELNGAESLKLFHSNVVTDSAENSKLFERVVTYTEGVPLALKVLRSLFHQCKGKEEVELLWEKLRKFPNKELQNVYRASYGELESNEREIFLDIACLHKGEDIGDMKRILAACGLFPEDGIRILIDRSLISLKDDCIWMHDVIQEMGVDIVNEECAEEPGNRSRLHNFEDVIHVLEKNTGTAKVYSIYLSDYLNRLTLCSKAFEVMHNLRFLMLRSVHFDNEANLESLPDALKYLFWHTCPLKSMPSKYHPKNLVELHMPWSNIQRLWNTNKNPENLKIIDLSYSEKLVEVAFLSNCVNIERIKLQGCIRLVQVPDLTKSVYIKSINLEGCINLVRVPDMSKSVNIESINLENCRKLATVPTYFQNFPKLTHLNLWGCSKISILPDVPCKIEFLDLSSESITSVPSSICSFEARVDLNLSGNSGRSLNHLNLSNSNIEKVPLSFECMRFIEASVDLNLSGSSKIKKSLSHLNLSGSDIEEVPSSFEGMTGLVVADLSHCRFLVSLPTNICKLKSLERLNLYGCITFKNFPEILEPMECLQCLDLSWTKIEELPSSIENLVGLKKLELSHCSRLTSLPSNIYNLNRLERFSLEFCHTLKPLYLLFFICSLTSLNLRHCTHLQEIPDCFDSLPALQSLDLTETMIETIPHTIEGVSGLRSLSLSGCKQLQSLPVLPCLLEELDARYCTSLKTVPVSVTALTQGLDQILLSEEREERHSFNGCFNLDVSARSNILDDAHHRIMRMATACNFERLSSGKVVLHCMGSKIPKWFNCQTEGSSINIKLPRHWSDTKLFLGFALSVVIEDAYGSYDSYGFHIWRRQTQCEMYLKTDNGEDHSVNLGGGNVDFITNDVIIWYNILATVPDEAKRSTEASLDFYVKCSDGKQAIRSNCVKRCGVCFLYADGQDDALKFEVIHPSAEPSTMQ